MVAKTSCEPAIFPTYPSPQGRSQHGARGAQALLPPRGGGEKGLEEEEEE